jgi:hypothetical protein
MTLLALNVYMQVELPLEFFYWPHHVVPCPEEAVPLLEGQTDQMLVRSRISTFG